MTKYTVYKSQLKGKPALVQAVQPYIESSGLALGEYRKLRRAVEDIFGNDLRLDIISMTRPNKAQARRL